ncbi:MAG: rRNA pseudouridine synthase [Acidobacteria bacterium]|nr:rRNA pseudouridine synthase [Acidobacteriota bacterium]MCG3194325.1 Ribosomal large subunit pseudouridine synthase B [Thermoanaerobaculia bacterium]MCK6681894.1 rRNA pseudouridine synthase [Thermoanaerobaculia bacterium]
MALERLQKILSAAGVASRRAAEELIEEGRVTVNGDVVRVLGAKADPEKDHIKVNGKLIRMESSRRYILLNKPKGFIVTRDDPEGRRTVFDLLGNRVKERVVPAGRLDTESEGLLILSNDGDFVHKITHPSGGCHKEYLVKVSGVPSEKDLERLRSGLFIDGKRTSPADVTLVRTTPEKDGLGGNSWLRVILGEGRSHQIRKMMLATGHPVAKLRRVAIGPVRDRYLKPGEFRDLTPEEIAAVAGTTVGTVASSRKKAAPAAEKPEGTPERPTKKAAERKGRR